ncbi:unnamed protein product [Triticum turgidum subsp. durum]|uniref:Glycosyltransferase n=1 Tax=Triticum turgidum subsp. durum TaxID=4567 RepID=A0A9R0WUK6_TRITD|nr:unnamed protein product [Triticum turgidum subsp. durum]
MALGGNAVAGRRRHVLLFPLAYQGHINPMFRLAGILHGRGFAVTVFHTHFNAPDPSRHPEYRFVPVPDGMSGPAPVAIEDVVSHILALNTACMSARDLVETAWGIAGSGVPFLWVVRPGLVAADGLTRLPDGFEEATRGRGMVVEWAPQEEVLRHAAVAGFWTHGGWNSTTESVCEGVPMLCRPHFGDQMGNARYVEHVWRVGFEVAGALERGGVEAAIRRLVTGSEGAQMRARAGELKKAAKECTGEAGSSGLAIGKLVDHMLAL